METQLLSPEDVQHLRNFRTQLQVWKGATSVLSSLWVDTSTDVNGVIQECITNEMPFTQSFDEFSATNAEWVEQTTENIDRVLRLNSMLKDGDDKIKLYCEGEICTLEKFIIDNNNADVENILPAFLQDIAAIRNMKVNDTLRVGMVTVCRWNNNNGINFAQECENIVRELDATDYNNIDEFKSRFNKLKEKSSELLACKTIMDVVGDDNIVSIAPLKKTGLPFSEGYKTYPITLMINNKDIPEDCLLQIEDDTSCFQYTDALVCDITKQWIVKRKTGDYWTIAGQSEEVGTLQNCINLLQKHY